VHLGHTRLAILDPAGGAQPLWNEDETICVVFNGEIYNHRPLREELVRVGHRFRSDHSDTEVLVHGFEEWGLSLLDRLNGMFAFALYDRGRRQLVLARDRMCEKPLFYAAVSGGLVFASELEALRRHPGVACAGLDSRALQKFFAYTFFPAPLTPYRGVFKLPQGHALTCDIGGDPVVRPYWRFRIEPDPPPGNIDSWTEELRGLLDAAVARRLESDVPLGLLISGGIDSSAVLSFAADHLPAEELQTFVLGFEEKSFDESEPAALMAQHVGSQHHERICRVGDARALIDDLLPRIAEPLGDPSILPTYMVSAFVREYVTVALTGDGGDELFAGYDPFRALHLAKAYDAVVPRPVHRAVTLMAGRLPLSDANMSLDFKLRRSLRGLTHPPKLWNPVWLGALGPDEIADLFEAPIGIEDLYSEAIMQWDASATNSVVDRTLEFYTNLYLPDDILVKSDRASMQVSLELRAPFLDNDLVDFVRRLPHDVKYRGGKTKWILRQAVADRLPSALARRKKKGFGIPLAQWLRTMPAPEQAPAIPGLREAALRERWRRHQAGQSDERGALWCWLALRRGLIEPPLRTASMSIAS
jgi:asparagine synthase (glutamine-hydrolysing)